MVEPKRPSARNSRPLDSQNNLARTEGRLAIARRIQQISHEVLQVQQGPLYPALHRLEQSAWIKTKWAESETGRQAKFYSLTAAGRAQLEKEAANWSNLTGAINLVAESV